MPKQGQIKPEFYEQLTKILPGKIHPKPKDSKYELLEDFHAEDMHTN